jgi:hypothetical protein
LDLHEGSGLLALEEAALMEEFKKRARYVHESQERPCSVESVANTIIEATMCL